MIPSSVRSWMPQFALVFPAGVAVPAVTFSSFSTSLVARYAYSRNVFRRVPVVSCAANAMVTSFVVASAYPPSPFSSLSTRMVASSRSVTLPTVVRTFGESTVKPREEFATFRVISHRNVTVFPASVQASKSASSRPSPSVSTRMVEKSLL